MPDSTRQAAGFILWRPQGDSHQYLLLKNAGHQTWGFPKGHLERGEEPLTGAQRELLEETGLSDIEIDPSFEETVSYEVTYGKKTPFLKVVHYYLGRLNTGEFIRSDEHDSGDWYGFDDAMALLQHDDSRMLLTAAEALLEFEQN